MNETDRDHASVLAVDIGGTKIMTSVFSGDGHILAKDICPTLADEGVMPVIERLFTAVDMLLDRHLEEAPRLEGIGIACAGAVDTERGLIAFSPNLPGWHDVPLAQMVREKYGVDTYLINDASAAALGEQRFGAGKGVDDIVLLTLGTGIGGGIIIGGELYLGACGAAGEIGHMTIDVNGPVCSCGNTGCLEVLASGTAIARDAVSRLTRGEHSSLVEMAGAGIESITAEKVGKAARAGDPLALDVLARAAGYLGVGLVNLVNIFNPGMIIIGGGMAELAEFLVGPARKLMMARAFRMSAGAARIVTAQLGNEAGVYGAAVFVREQALRRI